MKKEEAHRFKHKIFVSQYLVPDLMGVENQEIFVANLDKRLKGEELFAKIQQDMKGVSEAIESSSNEYRSISFFVFTRANDNLSDYENRATMIIDAIQSFFLQYHQTNIECVHLVCDSDVLRGIFGNRVTKH